MLVLHVPMPVITGCLKNRECINLATLGTRRHEVWSERISLASRGLKLVV